MTSLAPLQVFKCLADDTRLMLMLLIHQQGELCVCELTGALELSQPKVSRHLAHLRRCGLLGDRRTGQWVHYSLPGDLPDWVLTTLSAAAEGERSRLERLEQRLAGLGQRPERRAALC